MEGHDDVHALGLSCLLGWCISLGKGLAALWAWEAPLTPLLLLRRTLLAVAQGNVRSSSDRKSGESLPPHFKEHWWHEAAPVALLRSVVSAGMAGAVQGSPRVGTWGSSHVLVEARRCQSAGEHHEFQVLFLPVLGAW